MYIALTGGALALRALVNSVSASSETERQSDEVNEPGKDLRQLSTKLGEIFGDSGTIPSDGPSRSEKGEVRPIIVVVVMILTFETHSW